MTLLILLLVLALVFGAIVAQLVQTIRGDGLGLRPPPRSHPEEVDTISPYGTLV